MGSWAVHPLQGTAWPAAGQGSAAGVGVGVGRLGTGLSHDAGAGTALLQVESCWSLLTRKTS